MRNVHDCFSRTLPLSDRFLNFPSRSTRPRTSPELETFVLWILKSSLFVNLQINLFFILTSKNVCKIQPIRVKFAETNQQIRSRVILNTTNEKTLIGRKKAGISKRGLSIKSSLSEQDPTQLNRLRSQLYIPPRNKQN